MFAESEFRYTRWKKAVQKSMNWETTEPACNGNGMWSEVALSPTVLSRPGLNTLRSRSAATVGENQADSAVVSFKSRIVSV